MREPADETMGNSLSQDTGSAVAVTRDRLSAWLSGSQACTHRQDQFYSLSGHESCLGQN